MATSFVQLNADWNAEPNAPDPRITVEGSIVTLSFLVNPFQFDFEEETRAQLSFEGCWRYRLGPTNDEGWWRGQCRFSKLAPEWGEFYEVTGDLLADRISKWALIGPSRDGSKHFLFYLRDQTFECDASSWTLVLPPRRRMGQAR